MEHYFYIRWYFKSYLNRTKHLTLLEDGAYRRLLDEYYSNEGPLPTDRAKLYRLLRVTDKKEIEAVEKVLKEFFSERRGKLHNKRASKELKRNRKLSVTRAKAAKQKNKVAANAEQLQSKSPATVTESESYTESETETDKHKSRSRAPTLPSAAAAEAFSPFASQPFGSERFQKIWINHFQHLRDNGGTYTEAMENCIQFCRTQHIHIPNLFFEHKREIEKIEVKNSYKPPPPQ